MHKQERPYKKNEYMKDMDVLENPDKIEEDDDKVRGWLLSVCILCGVAMITITALSVE